MGRNREGERTMAEAEQDALEQPGSSTRCACGSERFVLEAYLEVEGGMPNPEPIEVEALTCPECGREYEPILTGNGSILRGEVRGYFDEDA
jgi:Zn finger protein HypA/HybF involved in hydrogenase expression